MDATLDFKSYHLIPDELRHDAGWGARLLWDEVMAGQPGVVWDRQDAFGDKALVESLWPVVDCWKDLGRARRAKAYGLGATDESIELREGDILVVGGPQRSGGYLYVTAVKEKPGLCTGCRGLPHPDMDDRCIFSDVDE